MSKSLQRLLVLRERQKKVAEGALHLTFDQQRREQAVVDAPLPGTTPGAPAQRADALVDAQAAREAAYLRSLRIADEVAERQLELNQAKRALKQVEKLAERRAQQLQEKTSRREALAQEDWVRARAHGEDEP